MKTEERLRLIKEVGEEILTEEELRILLENKKKILAYDGFEPSGKLHIAQGVLRTINVNKMIQAGVDYKLLVADWFAWINNKVGGDLDKIQTVGKYQIEVWKACGMDLDHVEFVWSHSIMNKGEYWKRVVSIARMNSVKRILRCSQIMGRSEDENLSAAQIFYPCMQCSDIFELGVDIAQLGMDQRKVNVLAREIAPQLGYKKPLVVSHHMLMGLSAPPETTLSGSERAIALKMSKSMPDSAIFMTDSEEEIIRKIKKAYCPEKIIKDNPIMEYCKYLVFEKYPRMIIERPAKFGGSLELNNYKELEQEYVQGKLHPMDLKIAVSQYLDSMINPVRKHFEKNKKAARLLEEVQSFEVTR